MSTEYAKGDRVSYTVMYGVSFGPRGTEYRTEYGQVTRVQPGGARNEPQATIAVENPQPGATRYVKRYVTDIAPAGTRREGPQLMPDGTTRFIVRGEAGAVTFFVPKGNRPAGPVGFHHLPGDDLDATPPPGPEEAWKLGYQAGRAGMGEDAAERQRRADLAGTEVPFGHLPLDGCDVLPGAWCRCDQGYTMGRDCGVIYDSQGADALWAELEYLYRVQM